jgi:hypothetical protein
MKRLIPETPRERKIATQYFLQGWAQCWKESGAEEECEYCEIIQHALKNFLSHSKRR